MTSQPVRYQSSVEQVQSDERDTDAQLNEQFHHIQDTTSKDYGHAVRAVHAKGHGVATGTLTIHDGLPPELAQGIFAVPGPHEAILRISTNAGDLLDDDIALPRGFALKVLGVEGERLPGSEGDTVQDFVMVNGPAFAAPDAKAFLKNLKLLAGTTDKAEGAKKALSAVLHAAEATLEAVGGQSALLKNLGGGPQVHPLGETYYSQTPFRYGGYIAKFALFPVSPALTQLTGDTVNTSGRPDALREDVREVMAEQGGTWELRVQLARDLDKQPIEDPTVPWDEKISPFQTVATLEVPPQLSWEKGVTDHLEDKLSFSPWHGVAAHQPLGGINRARNDTYTKSAAFRGQYNGCPMHQPSRLADLG